MTFFSTKHPKYAWNINTGITCKLSLINMWIFMNFGDDVTWFVSWITILRFIHFFLSTLPVSRNVLMIFMYVKRDGQIWNLFWQIRKLPLNTDEFRYKWKSFQSFLVLNNWLWITCRYTKGITSQQILERSNTKQIS